jgi:hypothetical protein
MINWFKKLFGIKDSQTAEETDPAENATLLVTPIVETTPEPEPVPEPAPEPQPVIEPVATVVEIASVAEVVSDPVVEAAGKKPPKKEKKTPAKPKKKAQVEPEIVVETPVNKTKKSTISAKTATFNTTNLKKKK